jgi:hypothetical protein
MLLIPALLTLTAPFGATRDHGPAEVLLQTTGTQSELVVGEGVAFHLTENPVTDLRSVDLPGGEGFVALWSENQAGRAVPHYAVHQETTGFSRVRETDYQIHMKRGIFDPLRNSPEFAPTNLRGSGNMHLVQFVCPPLEEFRDELARLGAKVHQFIPAHTRIVEMDSDVANVVAALPYVRWVGPFEANFRLEQELVDGLAQESLAAQTHCYVSVFEKGPAQKAELASKLQALGIQILAQIPDGYRLEALLSPEQIVQVAGFDEVSFIDRWTAPEDDLDKVRNVGGANTLQTLEGFTGQGVRGEVMDGNVRATHNAFQNGVLIHGAVSGDSDHGTKCMGCVFSDGTGNAAGKGMLPDGQPIFADYGQLGNRYTHTGQLLQAPYNAVFQSNSWGGGLTTAYNSTSNQMDDILFDFDITICQSQSNTGNQLSRPQAWAKNIVSVGAVRHFNTAGLGNDSWGGSGSIGPAADGRIKPDLCFWYDSILTTDNESDSDYNTGFGGTSAATPCVAGYVGLVQQMWAAGIFGNNPSGSTVFQRRAKATMARALLVNSATQYTFNGTGHDLTRTHQGWGLPDVATLQSSKDNMFFVHETDILTQGASSGHNVNVDGTFPEFKATLCYLDPAGTTSASQHRINDLSLKVTDPTGLVYWGNNGLRAGNYSTSGGSSNTKDVIENVFVENPIVGTWVVEVIADELNQDGHTETGALDADYSLVVTGITDEDVCGVPSTYCMGKLTSQITLPVLSSVGEPRVSVPGFQITMIEGIAQKPAQVFYGNAANNAPFQGGLLCVLPPLTRDAILTTDAQGVVTYTFDFSGKTVGATEYYQVWFRDPGDAFGSGLSDGLQVTYCP